MWGVSKNPSQLSNKKQEKGGLAESFRPENFIPGLIIGFIFGWFLDLSNPSKNQTKKKNFLSGKSQQLSLEDGDKELKMVFVVRQDLKMGAGKIASQCAHAATGMYAELIYSHRILLRQWEQSGQPKIVVTCKNQQEMNKIREAAENFGLPTFVVADAGRIQVSAGSKTVLAVGPDRLPIYSNQLTKRISKLPYRILDCKTRPVIKNSQSELMLHHLSFFFLVL